MRFINARILTIRNFFRVSHKRIELFFLHTHAHTITYSLYSSFVAPLLSITKDSSQNVRSKEIRPTTAYGVRKIVEIILNI